MDKPFIEDLPADDKVEIAKAVVRELEKALFKRIKHHTDIFHGKADLQHIGKKIGKGSADSEEGVCEDSLKDAENSYLGEGKEGEKPINLQRSGILMLDTWVKHLPQGDEKGVYYTNDLGGTNLRMARYELLGGSSYKQRNKTISVCNTLSEYGLDLSSPHTTATAFFDFIAMMLKSFIEETEDAHTEKIFKIAFSVGFPCDQQGLDTATIISWSKDFQTGRDTDDKVEGKDIGKLFKEALKRKGVPAELKIIVNDCVGALSGASYLHPRAFEEDLSYISVIVGTGFNLCYVEDDFEAFNYESSVIATEIGAMSEGLPLSITDLAVDALSPHPGSFLFEKLISGEYIGKVATQLTKEKLAERGITKDLSNLEFTCQEASILATDTTDLLSTSKDLLRKKACVLELLELAPWLKEQFKKQFDRSATMVACAILGAALRMKKHRRNRKIVCGMDGSLVTKNEWYVEEIRRQLRLVSEYIPGDPAKSITLNVSEDSSGMGLAALCAALKE